MMTSGATETLVQEQVGIILFNRGDGVVAVNDAAARSIGGTPIWGRTKAEVLAMLTKPPSGEPPAMLHSLTLRGARHGLGTALLIVPGGQSVDQTLLADVNQEMQAIIDSSFDEMQVTDGAGTTLRVNSRSKDFFGLEPEQMIGLTLEEAERIGLARPFVTRMVIEKRCRVTVLQETITGRRLVVTGNPIFDGNGTLTRVIMTSKDVTGMDRLSEALEESRSLVRAYQQELDILRNHGSEEFVVYRSKAVQDLVSTARRIADVDCTTLILGETGVGKEVIARAIHRWSDRRDQPFVVVNCGTIPEHLMESELFGYDSGAFTGARREGKVGLVEAANGGTLFLDEIGELPLGLQVKLLRVLQDREITRLGRVRPVSVDVRIIAATNQDLEQMVAERRFRQDLFYRLNVVPLTIPPLRERPEDILPLANHFLERLGRQYGRTKRLSPAVVDTLMSYEWPGNVRELEHLMERLVVTVEHDVIQVDDVPPAFVKSPARNQQEPAIQVNRIMPLKQAVRALEAELIRAAYERVGSSYKVADLLGVHQSTVIRKLQRESVIDAEIIMQ